MPLIKYDATETQNHFTKLAGIDSFVPSRPILRICIKRVIGKLTVKCYRIIESAIQKTPV